MAKTQPDGLTFSGSLQTGFEVHAGETDVRVFGIDDPIFLMRDDDSDKAYRLRFGAAYEQKRFGMKLRFDMETEYYPVNVDQAGEKVGESLADEYKPKELKNNISLEDVIPKLGYGYVWGNFGSFLTVSGGKIVENAWETEGDWADGYDGAGLVRFEFKPIEGLNFGFSLGNNTRVFNAVPLQSVFQNLIIGAKYANEGAGFSAVLAAKFDYGETYDKVDVDALTAGTSDPLYSVVGKQTPIEASKGIDLAFGVKYTGVPKLTLNLDGQITKIGSKEEPVVIDGKTEELWSGYADIRLNAGYQIIDSLSVNLLVKMLAADAVKDKDKGKDNEKRVVVVPFYIAPGVMYNVMPGLYVGLEARFYMDKVEDLDKVRANDGISLDHQIGYNDENFSFAIVPKAVLALSAQAAFIFYDEIAVEDGDLRNIFGCNFRWSF
ncbi:MAG: hypothetical protein LBS97_04490 [Treponema sp.]|nr:hypothetical protein [Treponema sp.]